MWPRVLKVFLMLPLVGLLCLGSSYRLSGTEEFLVCPLGCIFQQIQAAIDAANDGATIRVGDGSYTENLVIQKGLRLIGTGEKKVGLKQANPQIPALQIEAEKPLQVYIEDIAIGEPVRPDPDPQKSGLKIGIAIEGPAQVLLQHITISGQHHGILSANISRESIGMAPPQVRIQDVTVSFNVCAILTTGSMQIRRATIVENHGGICGMNNFSLEDSTISKNLSTGIFILFPGVSLLEMGPVKILRNVISENGSGIMLTTGLITQEFIPSMPIPSDLVVIDMNRIVNNNDYGVAFLSKLCGIPATLRDSDPINILGSQNEIKGNHKGDLCPADYPWPPGFVKP
ncbi:right-handed parallel beta-helix repeat-containing protein [Candidatus Acetothermia bacterium]|nr:right-handed parallel beta-helix repeat-containing protein [Candidatus Acetothermia bacterium]